MYKLVMISSDKCFICQNYKKFILSNKLNVEIKENINASVYPTFIILKDNINIKTLKGCSVNYAIEKFNEVINGN